MNDSELGRRNRAHYPTRRRQVAGRAEVAIVVFAVGGLGLAACSSGSPEGDSDASLQTVSYAYPGVAAVYTPELFIQSDPAMCAPFGVKPELTVLAPSAASPAVAAGKVDVTREGATSFLLTEAANPGAAKIVATITGGQPTKFWGAKDIHTVADLKGRIVAATASGATTDIAAREFLSNSGLTPGKDVHITYSNNARALFALGESGAIQGFVQTAPLPESLTQAGWHELVDVANDPQTALLFKTVISANTNFIQERPDAIKGLLQCLDGAEKEINADPKKAAEILAGAARIDLNAATAQVAVLRPFDLAQMLHEELQTIANVLQENNIKDFSDIDVSTAVDNSLVP